MKPTDEYFVWIDGNQLGPFSLEALIAKVTSGEMPTSVLCAASGDKDWLPFSDVWTKLKQIPHAQQKAIGFRRPNVGQISTGRADWLRVLAILGMVISVGVFGICLLADTTDSAGHSIPSAVLSRHEAMLASASVFGFAVLLLIASWFLEALAWIGSARKDS